MNPEAISAAAATIWRHWQDSTRIPQLPEHLRPLNRADAYDIQSALVSLSGQPLVGWKIAATAVAGQHHIGVDGPLAGSLLAKRVLASGSSVSLANNYMRVGEAEFAFRMTKPLPPRGRPYSVEEVLDAVGALQPTIEIPDSRYDDFARVGAPQLIADDACACWLLVGEAAPAEWRTLNLVDHVVEARIDGELVATGCGEKVLGDPRVALTWLANELNEYGRGLRPGDLVTTGTCIVPVTIAPGQRFDADFGALGALEVVFE
jgi:2-keto-4-pentenoate hydratase